MSNPTDPTLDAQHEANLELIREELRQRNETVALLQAELATYRDGTKTWPPASLLPPELDTDDLTRCKNTANILAEIHSLRSEVLTLSSEVSSLHRAVAEYTPVMDRVIEALQSDPRCVDCPQRKPTISIAPTRL